MTTTVGQAEKQPRRILFVCVENCNRSQMAEAFARMYSAGQVEAHSAGYRPAERVHPKAVAAMRELGYDLRTHLPKGFSAVSDVAFDVAVTLGCEGELPLLHVKRKEDWRIPCPKNMPPDEFRTVRDQIGNRVKQLLSQLGLQQAVRS